MSDTVWCLFSIANDYDQPDNNLEHVWLQKPKLTQLCNALYNDSLENVPEEAVIYTVAIFKGESLQMGRGGTTYRLEEVKVST